MATIGQAFQTLAGTDFYAVALPVVIAFAVTYGLLTKLDLFGEVTDRVSAVVALVIAVYVGHHAATTGMASAFSQLFGSTALALITVLVGLAGAALMGVTPNSENRVFQGLAAVVGIGLVGLAVSMIGIEAIIPGGVPAMQVAIPAIDLVTVAVLATLAAGVAYPVMGTRGGE